MKQLIRFIDLRTEDEGVLVDMEYVEENGEFKVLDLSSLKCYNILKGTVGELVEVGIVIKLAFAAYLIKALENNK